MPAHTRKTIIIEKAVNLLGIRAAVFSREIIYKSERGELKHLLSRMNYQESL